MSPDDFDSFEKWWKDTAFPTLEMLYLGDPDWAVTLDMIEGVLPLKKNISRSARRGYKNWFDESHANFMINEVVSYELEHLIASYCRYRSQKLRQQAVLAVKEIRDLVAEAIDSKDEEVPVLVKTKPSAEPSLPQTLPEPYAEPA